MRWLGRTRSQQPVVMAHLLERGGKSRNIKLSLHALSLIPPDAANFLVIPFIVKTFMMINNKVFELSKQGTKKDLLAVLWKEA